MSFLAPVFLLALPALFVALGAAVDQRMQWTPAPTPPAHLIVGVPLTLAGIALGLWSNHQLFSVGRGTPLPLMPTQDLVVGLPYARMRNPMALGAVSLYLGVATLFRSPGAMVVVLLGAAALLTYIRVVEERGLSARFGPSYLAYRRQTPFLFPRLDIDHQPAEGRHRPASPIPRSWLPVPAPRCRLEPSTGRRTCVGRLIYAANMSLDGFLEDQAGAFDWSVPDEEVHAFWNEYERGIGTSLYGRRMYETMRVWDSDDWLVDEPPVLREFASIWRDTDKVVFSSTLGDVSTARTTLQRTFEPEAVRQLKEASGSDLSIGGPGIAAEAFRHGLVDECVLLLHPVLVGGGKPALPRGVRLDLELLDQRRFANGVIHVRHAVRTP